MTSTTLEAIARLLGGVSAPGSFTGRRTAAADNLHIEVSGLGRLEFPISPEQAQRLVRVARPARHGLGERTILDTRVRDTGEIAKSSLKIDELRWKQTLMPVLDALGADLGTPPWCRLRAELHNMLVYAPGQFFVPHRDSEKVDDMVGTLVVTLPSSFQGGAIVVEHQGERAVYRALKSGLSFIAFYADCRHEVRPVRAGHRIVLTYNLILTDDPRVPAERRQVAVKGSNVLAEQLREHFKTPLPQHKWIKTPREPPRRLVYLLDHQYTERGLGWRRLKGQDHARVAALRAAAQIASCDMVLALADVHETWECESEGWHEPRCKCKLCTTLGAFLGDPEKTRIEWPLAEAGRRHVHSQLDTHDLPVSHLTRRLGRPFVLVLTKSQALFEREAALRRAWRTDHEWLARRARAPRSDLEGPGRAAGKT